MRLINCFLYIMKSLKIVFFIIVLFKCFGCNQAKIKPEKIDEISKLIQFKVELPDIKSLNPLLLSEFTDSIEYVQLETLPQCVLPPNINAYLTNDFIFTITRSNIYQFDTNGKFIRQIGRVGRGPGEFLLGRVGFDDMKRRILILSSNSISPLIFDFNGKFLGNINDSILASCFGTIELFGVGNGYFVHTVQPIDINHQWGCKPFEIITFDYLNNKLTQTLTNRMVCKVENSMHYQTFRPSLQSLSKRDSLFYYKSFYNDTLYCFNNNNIQPYAVVDFGKRKFPCSILNMSDQFIQNEIIGKMRIIEISIQKNCILLNIIIHKSDGYDHFICKYDMKYNTTTYHSNTIENDIDGGQSLEISSLNKKITPVYFENDYENVEKYFSKLDKTDLKYPELQEKFKQMQINRKDEMNPMLMILHFKK